MNYLKGLFLILLFSINGFLTYGQEPQEDEIRRLEQLQARALINNDTTALDEIWAANFIVNNPNNIVLDRQMALSHIKKDKIHYLSYETQIDKISFIDNVAIVMGLETTQPIGQTAQAGKTIKRRYTNIWMKMEDNWQLIAQQSTTVAVK